MSTDTVSPLRQRMIEDMNARKLCAETQRGHIHSCRRFAAFLKRSPDTATAVETAIGRPIGLRSAKPARPQIRTDQPDHENPQRECITLDRTRLCTSRRRKRDG